MARPHLEHLEQQDPAPNINSRHPEDKNRSDNPTGSSRTISTRRGITVWPAVETLTPLILALLFALAATALIFFFSSRQNLHPIPASSDSPSPFSIPTSAAFSPASPDSKKVFKMSAAEQTFIAIKPDGVQRGLIGPIISRFENRGFKLVAMKLVAPDEKHLRSHYADLDTPKNAKWFTPMIDSILGATDPLASAPGTIRGDYALDKGRNICHGSDSVENAQKEIALWFEKSQVLSWKHSQAHYFMEL
ncbi:hypothetical protein EsDP_00007159 [Epichloe bromicola]|uniref:Nucleoside diphosphate kinase n=1 Tax=Epichloe bromicola TaxID=79588 RepID=A0ABQ0CZR4_9HYPO